MTSRRRVIGQSKLFALARRGQPEEPPIEDAMRAAGLPTPEVEYIFAPDRLWRFDYAWPPFRLALEIEGGVFGRLIIVTSGYERRNGKSIPLEPGTRLRLGGRHNDGAGLQGDCEKYNRAAILEWMVIRATTTMVRDGHAITALREAFVARGLE